MSSPPPKKRSIRASIAHRLTKFASFKSPNDTQGTRDEPSGAAPRATSPVPSVSSLPPGSPNDSSSGAMTTGTCTTTLTPDPVETSALDYLANALRVLSQSAAMFPPLQAAVQGLIIWPSSVKEQANIIASKQGRGVGHYLAQAHKDQDEIMNAYRRIESLFRQLQCDVTLSVWNTIDEQLANTRIEALSPSKLAAYNSILSVEVRRRACANNTRTQLLREINDWSHDPDAPNIYWMNGMAGTGKTTVAYTFSESLKARKTLGASFFCSRTSGECRDVGRIIPTIAYQLARYSRPFQVTLTHILGNDPDIGTQTITHQFERLIKEPLASVKGAMPSGLVIVVDALDECSNTEGVGMILDMLFRRATSLPLKFFVTSRPEPSVHSRVLAQPDKTRLLLILHEIESSLVRADIEVYLREELSSDNVSETQLKQLAELSGNLFIYAATAIRYIRRTGGGIDHRRLGIILGASAGASRQYAEVDLLYASILADAIDNPRLEVVERTQIQFILWAVVCMREPVTVKALAELTGTEPVDAETALTPLFSVLHVSEATGTVSTLHASFPDFIFDQARSDRFHCNELEINQTIAQHCFGIMDRQLRFNLCGLESSFKCDDEAEGLTARVSKAISPTLSYVIGHWGDHLVPVDWAAVLDGSTEPQRHPKRRDQHAIEAKAMADGCQLRTGLGEVAGRLLAVPDALRSKLHSQIYPAYIHLCTCILPSYKLAIEQSQTALLATWNMHSETLSLAFSSDGSRLAVGFSDGTVSILDAHTGVPVLGPLREHTDYVRSVALSPDGSLLASCSDDSKVIVRDAYTGARMYDALKGHESWVTSVCFSPDGRNVLSGSRDHTTRIWDSRTGKAIPNSAKHHPHPVSYAAYSPDGKLIACGLDSDECPMIIYSASTGQPISGGFDAHQSSVEFVTFSPDEKNVVTGHASGLD
ncbi:Vegetative incompatibility protein HET-E-1 [Rhizoctonia solani AG-1 IB]|uniref:Vegetative incompatibility protein HET-E-1 n=1 Tax=Thanatephorus cucumeris (strain AG1-IB / isolate 7/3/14) TaxID=1108050 RepID=M5CA19_THACB|nr:Vegetative incompatibility protein HET-E-1 [Rhizoctonia solani AG-1 IB]